MHIRCVISTIYLLRAYSSFQPRPDPASGCASLSIRRSCASLSTRNRPLRRMATDVPVAADCLDSVRVFPMPSRVLIGFDALLSIPISTTRLLLTALACTNRSSAKSRRRCQFRKRDLALSIQENWFRNLVVCGGVGSPSAVG